MDPISIAATAASTAGFIITISRKTASIISSIRNADESISEFHASIETLRGTLLMVEETFKKGRKQNTFEEKHWQAISKIITSLNSCLYSLNEIIPDTTRSTANAIRVLRLEWQSDLVAAKRTQISSYTQCLQVSMTAVSLASQWQSQASQEGLHHDIKRLVEDIKKTEVYYRMLSDRDSSNSSSASLVDSRDIWREKQGASQTMEDWASSAKDVAKTMILRQSDEGAPADHPSMTRLHMDARHEEAESSETSGNSAFEGIPSGVSTEQTSTSLEENWENESTDGMQEPRLRPDDLEALIEEHRRAAENRIGSELYKSAEKPLRKLIDYLEQREGDSCEDVVDVRLKLARVLYEQRSEDTLNEAKSILKDLLVASGTSVNFEDSEVSSAKKLRTSAIRHSLASTYLALGKNKAAENHAKFALKERQSLEAPTELIDKSYLLLASISEQMEDYITAATWRKKVRRLSVSLGQPELNIFDWLKMNEFLPNHRPPLNRLSHSRQFELDYFNACHPETQQTPLQFAVTGEAEPGIIHLLIGHGAQREVKDAKGATPLLLAATTRHKGIVAAILANDVDTTATDHDGNSALHRVQYTHGGVFAARLLLDSCPVQAINAPNRQGRTPLHLAAEFGNQPMVEELLSREPMADINAKDFGHDNPLHLAILSRREETLISLLISRGADIFAKNIRGDDALQAARGIDKPMESVVKYLKEQKRIKSRTRQGSHASSSAQTQKAASITSKASVGTYGLSKVRLNHSSISLPFSTRYGSSTIERRPTDR